MIAYNDSVGLEISQARLTRRGDSFRFAAAWLAFCDFTRVSFRAGISLGVVEQASAEGLEFTPDFIK